MGGSGTQVRSGGQDGPVDARAPEARAELTDRQRQVFDFIVTFVERNHYSPTIREIGAELGIRNPNGVMGHLRAVAKKGYIELPDGKTRAIRITKSRVCPCCRRDWD